MKNKHRYPLNWNDTIRPDILRRDNYRCQNCRILHRTKGYYDKQKNFIEADKFIKDFAQKHGFKIQTIHLQIAHIDQNPNNNEYTNLKALCPKCHLTLDNQYNKIKRLQRKPTH